MEHCTYNVLVVRTVNALQDNVIKPKQTRRSIGTETDEDWAGKVSCFGQQNQTDIPRRLGKNQCLGLDTADFSISSTDPSFIPAQAQHRMLPATPGSSFIFSDYCPSVACTYQPSTLAADETVSRSSCTSTLSSASAAVAIADSRNVHAEVHVPESVGAKVWFAQPRELLPKVN
jgi:hypothetical protein